MNDLKKGKKQWTSRWCPECPSVALFFSIITPQRRKEPNMTFSCFWMPVLSLRGQLDAHSLLFFHPAGFWKACVDFKNEKKPKTTNALKGNVSRCGVQTVSCTLHDEEEQPGGHFLVHLNTAQPEFFCCKTKLTMLFYICLCIHMQCILLHVCMSMRPMVLSMICLIYGLHTLINH